MVKDFFEYIKELIPEEGRSHFTIENHTTKNNVTLYQVANMIGGEKCFFADEVVSYCWNVPELWRYPFPTMGIKFARTEDGNYEEIWCHFSKEAFVGAICIVAIKNGVTFNDEAHEQLRQMWEHKLNKKETAEEKQYFDRFEYDCMNFEDVWYIRKPNAEERGDDENIRSRKISTFRHVKDDYKRRYIESLQKT